MIERGGDVVVKVVANATKATLQAVIQEHVIEGTEVHTDQFRAYDGLESKGYDVKRVNKIATGKYVGPNGERVHAIENFWRHLKCSIQGTHISVSHKYLVRYAKDSNTASISGCVPRRCFRSFFRGVPNWTLEQGV